MPVKLYRRGAIWHFAGTVAGRRLRRSTRTSDRALAQRIAAEAEVRAWKRHLDGPGAGVTFAQASIAYRQAEKPTRFLAAIEDHWRDTPLREITGEAVRQAARRLYPHAAAATRNRQVIVPAAAVINHAAALGWCSPIKVRRFPIDPQRKVAATRAWVEAFAAQAERDSLPHFSALALFLFGTGARVSEATALVWRDVDLAQASAVLRLRKPRPWTREAHLPPPVVAALARLAGTREEDARVFGLGGRGSVTKAWNNIARRAGIEPLTPHCLRHGFATAMLRQGFDVATVAARGGWRDPSTVLRTYAHAIEDRTVTDALFGTPLTQEASPSPASTSPERRKGR